MTVPLGSWLGINLFVVSGEGIGQIAQLKTPPRWQGRRPNRSVPPPAQLQDSPHQLRQRLHMDMHGAIGAAEQFDKVAVKGSIAGSKAISLAISPNKTTSDQGCKPAFQIRSASAVSTLTAASRSSSVQRGFALAARIC